MKQMFISIFVLLLMVLSTNDSHAQNDPTKSFLFLSVFCEPANLSFQYSTEVVDYFCRDHENFSFECSKPIKILADPYLESLGFTDSLWDFDKYAVQLFRVKQYPQTPPYYIMRMDPCFTSKFSNPDTLWIRISGYQESDIKPFFDALRRQGMKKKDLVYMIEKWCESDSLFDEIDWQCIIEGYFKNNTHSNCYISNAYLFRDILQPDSMHDIYAIFSKNALYGTMCNRK